MTEWVTGVVEALGYAGVFGLMVLENVLPPIPSEVIMPLAGFASARGDLSFVGVVLAGTLGSVVGALPLYYLGHAVGERRLRSWVERRGRWLGLGLDDLDRVQASFDRHGRRAVLLGRLVPGVRSLISVPAGVAGMPLVPFLLYTALGSGAWSALLALAGRLLGADYGRVEGVVGPAGLAVFGGLAVALVVWVIRRRRRGARR
jgi:membrane protein DedA with SNARE-associated domain